MEIARIYPREALPATGGAIQIGSLLWLDNKFRRKIESTLPSVTLVCLPEGLLTLDGHHRLLTALKYGRDFQADIYFPKEVCILPYDEVDLDINAISRLKRLREISKIKGYHTFEDLYKSAIIPANYAK